MPGTIDNVGAAAAPENFNDVLHEWMERAPWLALSLAAHALVILILVALPWDELRNRDRERVICLVALPEPELFEDPPPEETPELLEQPEIEEPRTVDSNLVTEEPSELSDEFDVAEGDPQDLVQAAFSGNFDNSVIGMSGNVDT